MAPAFRPRSGTSTIRRAIVPASETSSTDPLESALRIGPCVGPSVTAITAAR